MPLLDLNYKKKKKKGYTHRLPGLKVLSTTMQGSFLIAAKNKSLTIKNTDEVRSFVG